MTNSIIKEFLKRPIAYQPIVAKAFGSVKLAILWCQFYYWMDKGENEEGWIYKTMDQVYEETGLKRKAQETARKLGNELGVLESKAMGAPATVHFRVNLDRAEEIIVAFANKGKAMKLFEDPKPISPGEFTRKFFDQGIQWMETKEFGDWPEFLEIAKQVAEKIGKENTKIELKKFILYWTEPTKSGKKVRWETQSTFEVKRRLITWLGNKVKFAKGSDHKRGVEI